MNTQLHLSNHLTLDLAVQIFQCLGLTKKQLISCLHKSNVTFSVICSPGAVHFIKSSAECLKTAHQPHSMYDSMFSQLVSYLVSVLDL